MNAACRAGGSLDTPPHPEKGGVTGWGGERRARRDGTPRRPTDPAIRPPRRRVSPRGEGHRPAHLACDAGHDRPPARRRGRHRGAARAHDVVREPRDDRAREGRGRRSLGRRARDHLRPRHSRPRPPAHRVEFAPELRPAPHALHARRRGVGPHVRAVPEPRLLALRRQADDRRVRPRAAGSRSSTRRRSRRSRRWCRRSSRSSRASSRSSSSGGGSRSSSSSRSFRGSGSSSGSLAHRSSTGTRPSSSAAASSRSSGRCSSRSTSPSCGSTASSGTCSTCVRSSATRTRSSASSSSGATSAGGCSAT